MSIERFANSPTPSSPSTAWSTLSSSYTSGGTSITPVSTTPFPSAAQFQILIDDELFKVTNVAAGVWTVVGAQGGTSPANHAAGASIYHVLTAASLLNNPLGLTTAGDIPYLNSSLNQARLAAPSNGDYLWRWTSGVPSYVAYTAVAPASPANSIQFNNAGSFGGNAALTFDGSTLRSGATTASLPADLQFTMGFSNPTNLFVSNTSSQETVYVASSSLWGIYSANYGADVQGIESDSYVISGSGGSATAFAALTGALNVGAANTYAFFVESPIFQSGGSAQHCYGLYVQDLTGGSLSNHAIYTNAGLVRFGDAVTATDFNGGTWNGKTLTLANSFTTSGNFALTLTQTNTTNVTLPTTGTLATLAGSEAFTNKTGNISQWTNDSGYLTSVSAHNLLSATHGDTTAGSVSRGDVITGQGASPKWVRLAKGTANQVLSMDGTATDIVWATATASVTPLVLGTNLVEQYNSTNAQSFYIYNTRTDATTNELAKLEWVSNVFRINVTHGSVGGSFRGFSIATGGTDRLTIDSSGNFAGAITSLTVNNDVFAGANFLVGNGASIKFSDGSVYSGNIRLDAADTVAQRNATTAQAMRWYNTFSSATSYERFSIDWKTTSNTLLLGTEKGSGGGTARVLQINYGGTTTAALSVPITSGGLTFGGPALLPASTTSLASLRVPHGSAPTSPVDGDIWTTTSGLFVRINGSTVGPLT